MINYKNIEKIVKCGDSKSFYYLDVERFRDNYINLINEFKKYYNKTIIAYSYKTNYIPLLCNTIKDLGGYAEVVSDMELSLARAIGVPYERIEFNGPYKDLEVSLDLLENGGMLNIDNLEELSTIVDYCKQNTLMNYSITLRCNFDLNDSSVSRFGLDVPYDFEKALSIINNIDNLSVNGIHCHFAARYLDIWKEKVKGILGIVKKYKLYNLEHISLGGGLFGPMHDSLKEQFDNVIPNFADYANIIAKEFNEFYKDLNNRPVLIIEPGSALVGDAMKFVCPITSIKKIRNHSIATVLGSIYNINPTLNTKNPPIEIVKRNNNNRGDVEIENYDIAGYTCIETDYLYRNFNGLLEVGDYLIFSNIGSYSIVLKPPFILPNFPIISLLNEEATIVKSKETFKEIFQTYEF